MNLSEYQSGQYEAQYEYRSFLPAQINHPWVITDPALLQLQSQADRALGELNAFSQLVPDVDFFIQMYVAKEATYSSRIEGTQTKERIDREVLPRFSVRRQDNAQQLMRYLYRHPVADVKTITALLETTQKTAGALIEDMVSHGVLVEITGQRRNRLFVFKEYLALFTR